MPPQWLLAAWPRRVPRLKLLVVCTPLVPPSLPLLPMSLCYHLSREWTPVSDVGNRDAHVMVSCGCVAYSCCATHSCSAWLVHGGRRRGCDGVVMGLAPGYYMQLTDETWAWLWEICDADVSQ